MRPTFQWISFATRRRWWNGSSGKWRSGICRADIQSFVEFDESDVDVTRRAAKPADGTGLVPIGLLASALARPATTVMDVEAYPQLAMKAAALMESVVRFHSLIDGNKRTAWTLMVLMLWMNGYPRDFSPPIATLRSTRAIANAC